MTYYDNTHKALAFAKARVRSLAMPLADRRAKYDRQLAVVETQRELLATRQRAVAREERRLDEIAKDIAGREHDSAVLKELIAKLEMPRTDFPELSDEEFDKRQSDLRWEIGDYTGGYTFVADPFGQGGF